MPCAHKHRQGESAQGGEERDAVGMPAQQPFGNLDEPVHAARGLQYAGAGHGRDDDVDHVGWGRAGFHAEAEDKYGQANARDRTKGKAAIAGIHVESE